MKEIIRYGLTLGLICTVASASLAIVNSITKPRIIAQAQTAEKASLQAVMSSAEHFEPVKSGEEIIYYRLYNKDGEFIGVAFKSQGKGYSSIIETMVGMTKDGTITSIEILSHNETPGLGASITAPFFTKRFTNKNMQDLAKIQAITGATISSKAIIDSVKKKAEEIKGLMIDE